ncbi:mechanosensitive ion channel family protein [Caldisalinibacter kiritimatiensis]|uniref:Small-conductance mechanosensitive channel n=1 Tax=Caldisalinibacter kiritimatiensis TaxID=1304284 RepID=R1CUW3_9FIRM|nr:mechanosensitive ion channel family protein [Caldisalinibacter kiritimatiensis]EOD00439.1 small-conductance mechanosensitive channel [Caldisalinibacter kiritimatiensis]
MEFLIKINELSKTYLNIPAQSIGIALGIFLFFTILRRIFSKYIIKLISLFTSKTKSQVDDDILRAFQRPLASFIAILGIYLALMYLPLSQAANITITKFFRAYIIIMIAWGLYNLEGTYIILHEKMQSKFNFKSNKILKPFLTKALRFITIAIAIGIVAQEFDYDVSGFVAGLGLGGLAVAMAAKDTLANVFGGIVIIMDKPFDIGDWIKSGDTEGVVEDINFRSTKIRTFSKALVTVPNSKLVDTPIFNYSRRGIRRITFKLGVTYNTPKEKLKGCIYEIERMLNEHPQVDKETIFVKFDEFNDSSLDIFLYFFTNTSNWEQYLNIKQDINFKIMDILEKEGVSVAFPSNSIYFENNLTVDNKQ